MRHTPALPEPPRGSAPFVVPAANTSTQIANTAATRSALPRPMLSSHARVSGLDPTQLGGALRHCCTHPRMGACDDEPRPTPRVVRLLAAAAQIAFAEGERELRAGHLVRVLLMEPGAVAWSGLARAGLSPAVVRAGIARLAAASPAEGRGHAN